MRRKNHIEFSQPENRSRTSGGTIIPALLIVCWMFGESSMGNCRMPSTATDQDCFRARAGLCQGEDSHIPIPAGIAFEGDSAYAGEYSHRPIPAGIALVTFVTFPRTMSQTQSQLGLLRVGTRLMPVGTATYQSQLGLLLSLL